MRLASLNCLQIRVNTCTGSIPTIRSLMHSSFEIPNAIEYVSNKKGAYHVLRLGKEVFSFQLFFDNWDDWPYPHKEVIAI